MSTSIAAAIDARIAAAQDRQVPLATVTALASLTVQITRNGQPAPDTTFYRVVNDQPLNVGDVVCLLRVGASYVVLGGLGPAGATVPRLGQASLPAHSAGTYALTIADVRVGQQGLMFFTTHNKNGDTTANRSLTVALVSWVAGTSFTVEYRTNATMAHDWELLYWILG